MNSYELPILEYKKLEYPTIAQYSAYRHMIVIDPDSTTDDIRLNVLAHELIHSTILVCDRFPILKQLARLKNLLITSEEYIADTGALMLKQKLNLSDNFAESIKTRRIHLQRLKEYTNESMISKLDELAVEAVNVLLANNNAVSLLTSKQEVVV